jgi:hypothetical protein
VEVQKGELSWLSGSIEFEDKILGRADVTVEELIYFSHVVMHGLVLSLRTNKGNKVA